MNSLLAAHFLAVQTTIRVILLASAEALFQRSTASAAVHHQRRVIDCD